MRILIAGSDTSLGEALHDHLLAQGRHQVAALPLAQCRWKSERQAKKALKRADARLVVDTRIVTFADSGEPVHDLDVGRTLWLARACHRSGVGYLYVSSARVFSGSVERLYTEDDYPDNDSSLGELLLRSETAVRDSCEKHLILRLGPVFSLHPGNALARVLGKLLAGETLRLASNFRGSPVVAEDAARVVAAVADQLSTRAPLWGIYHYCSSEITNCYEFAETVLAAANQYRVLPSDSVQLEKQREVSEVVNQALDCSRIRSTFAIQQAPWRGAVAAVVKQYFDRQSN